ncbi:hypothetical protein EAF00_011977 [Botryotinia globosa]|nr:hypothetical protein EAF00_011977 [Botryotinia globosa]
MLHHKHLYAHVQSDVTFDVGIIAVAFVISIDNDKADSHGFKVHRGSSTRDLQTRHYKFVTFFTDELYGVRHGIWAASKHPGQDSKSHSLMGQDLGSSFHDCVSRISPHWRVIRHETCSKLVNYVSKVK